MTFLVHLQSKAAENSLTFFVNAFKIFANSAHGKFGQNPNIFNFAKLCLYEIELKRAISSKRFLRVCMMNKGVAIVEYEPEEIL